MHQIVQGLTVIDEPAPPIHPSIIRPYLWRILALADWPGTAVEVSQVERVNTLHLALARVAVII